MTPHPSTPGFLVGIAIAALCLLDVAATHYTT